MPGMHMRQWTGSSLDHVVTCRLFGTKPLSEWVLKYCQLNPEQYILMKFYSEFKTFHWRKFGWIYRLQNAKPMMTQFIALKCSGPQCLDTVRSTFWYNGWLWLILKTWWRHQMETFSALLTICAGNSPVSGEFPTQRPVTRNFDVFFDLCPINDWVNNREAGDLRRSRAHYDVIVMKMNTICLMLETM